MSRAVHFACVESYPPQPPPHPPPQLLTQLLLLQLLPPAQLLPEDHQDPPPEPLLRPARLAFLITRMTTVNIAKTAHITKFPNQRECQNPEDPVSPLASEERDVPPSTIRGQKVISNVAL